MPSLWSPRLRRVDHPSRRCTQAYRRPLLYLGSETVQPTTPGESTKAKARLPELIARRIITANILLINHLVLGAGSHSATRPRLDFFAKVWPKNAACRDSEPCAAHTGLYCPPSALALTSSVITSKCSRRFRPKAMVIGTSPASRPRPIRIRPMRRRLWRASNVCQCDPR
jgi:hypothetical protein